MLSSVKEIEDALHMQENPWEIDENYLQIKNFSFSKILLIVPFVYSKLLNILPALAKDILLWHSFNHKSPLSTVTANTRYESLRIKCDIFVSNLVLLRYKKNKRNALLSIAQDGFIERKLGSLDSLDAIFLKALRTSKPRHAGARPFLRDKNQRKIANSISAYFDINQNDCAKITDLIRERSPEIDQHLSMLAGYHASFKNISYSLAIVYGQNSNSEFHQDTWSGIAKGFIYLSDVDETCSPFEYCKSSYQDAEFRAKRTNNAVMAGEHKFSRSTRLRGRDIEDAITQFELKTIVGDSGHLTLANTSGYHRKGQHLSSKPRVTLTFQIPRKNIISKLLINLSKAALPNI